MRDAASYPISFPYGSTDPPYSPQHKHRGDDRACPTGTPIIIGGTTIGMTGATGFVIGAHLHIQEFKDDYSNVRKPQNAFKPGIVTVIDPNGTIGDGTFGKFVVTQNADGWSDSYCHLSQINVKVGQRIGDSMPDIDWHFNYVNFLKAVQKVADELGVIHDADHVDVDAMLAAVKKLKTDVPNAEVLKSGIYKVI